jgi:hypothetical protein
MNQKRRFTWVGAVLINVAIVVVPIAIYLFVYLETSRSYLTGRHFRALDEVAGFLQTRLDQIGLVFRFAPRPPGETPQEADSLEEAHAFAARRWAYAGEALKFNRSFKSIDVHPAPLARLLRACFSQPVDFDLQWNAPEWDDCPDTTEPTDFCAQLHVAMRKNPIDKLRFELDRTGTQTHLNVIDCRRPQPEEDKAPDSKGVIPLEARLPLDDLLNVELFGELFDELLIAESDGQVIARKNRPLPGFSAEFNVLRHVRHAANPEPKEPSSDKPDAAAGISFEPLVIRPVSEKSAGDAALQSAVIETTVGNVAVLLFVRPFRVPLDRLGGTIRSPDEEVDLETDRPTTVWYLCGVVRQGTFEAKVRQIPLTAIAVLALLLLLGFLSWPYLKTAFLGPIEKLRPADVHFLLASLVLSTGLVTLLLAEWWVYYDLRDRLNDATEEIAERVGDDFKRETDLARERLLRAIDPLISRPGEFEKIKDFEAKGTGVVTYPLFDLLVVVDRQGRVATQRQVTFRDAAGPGGSVMNRDYFQRSFHRNGWRRPVPNGKSETSGIADEFFIERIETYDHGIKLAAVSVPLVQRSSAAKVEDSSPAVAAAIKKYLTFSRPVLPPAFGVAIVEDATGRVLFHSRDERSLIENFYLETDGNLSLQAAVKMRRSQQVDGRYQGRSHSFHTMPLHGIPWTVVAFYDKAVAQSMHFELVTVVAAFLVMYAGLFGFVVVVLTVALSDTQWSWLWPRRSLAREYCSAVPALLGLIAFQSLVLWNVEGWWPVVAVLSAPPLVIGMLYLRFKEPVASQPARRWFAIVAAVAGGIGMFSCLLGFRTDGYAYLLVLPISLAAALATVALSRNANATYAAFRRSYVLTAFLCLIALGVFPSMFIFKDVLRIQADKIVRFAQLHQTQAMEARQQELRDDVMRRLKPLKYGGADVPRVQPQQELRNAGVYAFDDILGNLVTETDRPSDPVDPHHCRTMAKDWPSGFTSWLVSEFPPYSDTASRIRAVMSDRTGRDDWGWHVPEAPTFWTRQCECQGHGTEQISFWKRTDDGSGIVTDRSQRLYVRFEASWFAALFLLVSGGAFFVLYVVVHSLAGRLLGLDMVDSPAEAGPPEVSTLLQRNRVLVQPSKALVADLVEKARQSSGDRGAVDLPFTTQFSRRSWLRLEPVDAPQAVVFKNCDAALMHPEQRVGLLEVLEHLVYKCGTRVVLVCEVLPLYRLLNPGAYPEAEDETTARSPDIPLRWSTLLSHFDKDRYPDSTKVKSWRECEDPVEASLLRECSWSEELREIGDRIRGRLNARRMTADEVVAAVLDEAGPYYRRLWLLCTKEERLLLIHMAQGNLANPKNLGSVERLLRRGLLRRDPDLQLLNRSFAGFARSAEPAERVEEWERAHQSAWSVLRIPLLLALLTGLGFIAYAQREAFNSTVGLLGALMTGLPILLRAWTTTREAKATGKIDA